MITVPHLGCMSVYATEQLLSTLEVKTTTKDPLEVQAHIDANMLVIERVNTLSGIKQSHFVLYNAKYDYSYFKF